MQLDVLNDRRIGEDAAREAMIPSETDVTQKLQIRTGDRETWDLLNQIRQSEEQYPVLLHLVKHLDADRTSMAFAGAGSRLRNAPLVHQLINILATESDHSPLSFALRELLVFSSAPPFEMPRAMGIANVSELAQQERTAVKEAATRILAETPSQPQ